MFTGLMCSLLEIKIYMNLSRFIWNLFWLISQDQNFCSVRLPNCWWSTVQLKQKKLIFATYQYWDHYGQINFQENLNPVSLKPQRFKTKWLFLGEGFQFSLEKYRTFFSEDITRSLKEIAKTGFKTFSFSLQKFYCPSGRVKKYHCW